MYSSVFDPLKAHLERPKSPRPGPEPLSLRRTPPCENHRWSSGASGSSDLLCCKVGKTPSNRQFVGGAAGGNAVLVSKLMFFGNECGGMYYTEGMFFRLPAGGDCPGDGSAAGSGTVVGTGASGGRRRRHDGRDIRRSGTAAVT